MGELVGGRGAPLTPLPAEFQKQPGVGTKEAFCLSKCDVCFAFDKPLCKPPF